MGKARPDWREAAAVRVAAVAATGAFATATPVPLARDGSATVPGAARTPPAAVPVGVRTPPADVGGLSVELGVNGAGGLKVDEPRRSKAGSS